MVVVNLSQNNYERKKNLQKTWTNQKRSQFNSVIELGFWIQSTNILMLLMRRMKMEKEKKTVMMTMMKRSILMKNLKKMNKYFRLRYLLRGWFIQLRLCLLIRQQTPLPNKIHPGLLIRHLSPLPNKIYPGLHIRQLSPSPNNFHPGLLFRQLTPSLNKIHCWMKV